MRAFLLTLFLFGAKAQTTAQYATAANDAVISAHQYAEAAGVVGGVADPSVSFTVAANSAYLAALYAKDAFAAYNVANYVRAAQLSATVANIMAFGSLDTAEAQAAIRAVLAATDPRTSDQNDILKTVYNGIC